MKWIIAFLAASLATTGFAVLFNAPRKTILAASINGGLSWIIYDYTRSGGSNFILSAFLAAFFVGAVGELLARIYHCPATLFILPGLIPLVPGAGMYYSMSYLIAENYEQFTKAIAETLFIASSLSIGIVASSIFSKSLRLFKFKRTMKDTRIK